MSLSVRTAAGVALSLLAVGLVVGTFRYFLESRLKRVAPRLAEYVPGFIWVFFLGIATGVAVKLALGMLALDDLVSPLKLGTGMIRDPAIALVLVITGGIQATLGVRLALMRTRDLALPAAIGSLAVGIGAIGAGTIVWYFLRQAASPDWEQLWKFTVRGATANANGWIGDSTTIVPALALLDDPSEHEAGDLVTPHVLVLDQGLGIAWFFLASLVATRLKMQAASVPRGAEGTKADRATNEERRRTKLMPIVIAGGVLVGVAVQALGHAEQWKTAAWRPPAVILMLLGATCGGYFAARRCWFLPDKQLRSLLMLVALAAFGVGSGLTVGTQSVSAAPSRFGALAACAAGMFAVHVGALILLRKWLGHDWGKLAVASMCAIGGLASAPMVAGRHSDEYIEASYATALLCNVLSVPISAGVYFALGLL